MKHCPSILVVKLGETGSNKNQWTGQSFDWSCITLEKLQNILLKYSATAQRDQICCLLEYLLYPYQSNRIYVCLSRVCKFIPNFHVNQMNSIIKNVVHYVKMFVPKKTYRAYTGLDGDIFHKTP